MKTLRPYQLTAINECWNALKLNDDPVLLMSSVGSGKSLMLGSILLTMQKANKKALCLVNNAELVRNNCETFRDQGGLASIFCAALGIKDISQSIIFATPQTILNAINKNHPIGFLEFNIIMVDEAHTINYLNHRLSFVRVLRHYKQQYPDMRVLGATGTNFRFKGASIVGPDCLFKTQVGNITTEQLIANNYLIEPTFQVDDKLVLDFSKVKIKRNGMFDQQQLEHVVEESARLTELICTQVMHIMETQKRFGVFFFATTKKHAFEIYNHLPPSQSAIILGETPQHERTEILDKARKGEIKYLVNIAIISVGVDVPAYDTIAYLRPTESLVLLVQTMGRVLRLSPKTSKKEALILDFAGNIERHRDWDNPILLKAIQQTIEKDKPLVIQCPECLKYNTESARRCIGIVNEKRCDYFFEFKLCPAIGCHVKNDISTRYCRICETEIIDPNEKLNLQNIQNTSQKVEVLRAKFKISGTDSNFRINCIYECRNDFNSIALIHENYSLSSEKAKYVFYGQFVRKHCEDSYKWFTHLNNRAKIEQLLGQAKIPIKLLIGAKENSLYIKKKIFE